MPAASARISILDTLGGGKRVLLAVAAPAELKAVLAGLGAQHEGGLDEGGSPWRERVVAPGVGVVLTGVGKANAAGAVGHVLRSEIHAGVLSVGIAGALPPSSGDPPLSILDAVAATSCVLSDEGVQSPTGFRDLPSLGFPFGRFEGSGVPVDEGWRVVLGGVAGRSGAIATVSTCSGTDALAREVAARTGALAEGMEGAAVALVAHTLGLKSGELRVISNTTGDRDRQIWRVGEALSRLTHLIRAISSV